MYLYNVRVHAYTCNYYHRNISTIYIYRYVCVCAFACNVLWAQDCQNLNQLTEQNDDRD